MKLDYSIVLDCNCIEMNTLTRDQARALFTLCEYNLSVERMLSLSFLHIIWWRIKPEVERWKVIETARIFNSDIADELVYIFKEAVEGNTKIEDKVVMVKRWDVESFIKILEARGLLSD